MKGVNEGKRGWGGTAISVENVTKEFSGGEIVALDRVSLTIPIGEFVAIIGSSGAGKSTLLRLFNGLQQPTSGTVNVLGVNVHSASRSALRGLRRRVGCIFQQFHLVGRSSCLENVLTGSLGVLRGPRYGVLSYPRELRVRALAQLKKVGLGDRAFQRADKLSGGQQQRVAIARALIQEPHILLADEPIASLDPESSRQVMDILRHICETEGITVVCNLHQIEWALGYAQRMVGLSHGRVVLDEPSEHLTTEDALRVYKQAAVANE